MSSNPVSDDWVFILLRDGSGPSEAEILNGEPDFEELLLGHLSKKTNGYGVVRQVGIDVFDRDWGDDGIELLFEDLCPEELHIPYQARIKSDWAFTTVLNGANKINGESEEVSLDADEMADASDSERRRSEALFASIVQSAQHLLERVERNEPVLVGYRSEPYSGPQIGGKLAGC